MERYLKKQFESENNRIVVKEDGPQISGSISVSPENSAGKRTGKKVKSRKPIVPTITIGGAPNIKEHYAKYFEEGDADPKMDIYKTHGAGRMRLVEIQQLYASGGSLYEARPLWRPSDLGYDIDTRRGEMSKLFRKTAKRVADNIRRDLLPKIKGTPFKNFTIHFYKSEDDDRHLGRYMNGSSSQPMIFLDIDKMDAAYMHFDNEQTAIETTIVHELAHACQEAKGYDVDEKYAHIDIEKEAENAAYWWWKSRKLKSPFI